MDAGDDVSDSASMYSVDRSVVSARQRGVVGGGAKSVAAESGYAFAKHDVDVVHRPVSSLKPKVNEFSGVVWCFYRLFNLAWDVGKEFSRPSLSLHSLFFFCSFA